MRNYLAVIAATAMLCGCGEVGKNERDPRNRTEQHDDHGHSHDHGDPIDLGTTTTAGVSYKVAQLGEPHGGEVAVEIELAEDSPAASAVRAWVGSESAEGSVKAKADGTGPHYEMHVELPDPAPADARLWVEIESAAGERAAAPFELK